MTLAETHILAQARLRGWAVDAVAEIWQTLPAYDEADVGAWLARVQPIVLAAQRQSVALTNAYLARSLERQPVAIDTSRIIGAAARNGADPAEVYRRPFVNIWTALKGGTPYADAVAAGLARATSTAATDVQLAMRGAVTEIGRLDTAIKGYRRVADAGACRLCVAAAAQHYHVGQLMPIHSHCGCGVEPLTADIDLAPAKARYEASEHGAEQDIAVHEHGELGPVLAEPGQHFTSELQLH